MYQEQHFDGGFCLKIEHLEQKAEYHLYLRGYRSVTQRGHDTLARHVPEEPPAHH